LPVGRRHLFWRTGSRLYVSSGHRIRLILRFAYLKVDASGGSGSVELSADEQQVDQEHHGDEQGADVVGLREERENEYGHEGQD